MCGWKAQISPDRIISSAYEAAQLTDVALLTARLKKAGGAANPQLVHLQQHRVFVISGIQRQC